MRLIFDFARQGESLCLMGVAGTGKSNITNFLRYDPYQHKPLYLKDETPLIHFPVVDGNTWGETPRSLWRMMLTALTECLDGVAPPPPDGKIIQLSEDAKALSDLKTLLNWVCGQFEHRVMFILDDFDAILRVGPLSMLEQLNALRSEGKRNQLSYLLFTKKLPHILGQAHFQPGTSKFYDLFSNHVYALGLYNFDDARQMLLALNENAGRPLSTKDLPLIQSISGGHARLLKIVFELFCQSSIPASPPIDFFIEQPDVRNEFQRIFQALHPDEQAVALRLAAQQHTRADVDLINHLALRGLLIASNPPQWFSPLMVGFLQRFAASTHT